MFWTMEKYNEMTKHSPADAPLVTIISDSAFDRMVANVMQLVELRLGPGEQNNTLKSMIKKSLRTTQNEFSDQLPGVVWEELVTDGLQLSNPYQNEHNN